MRILHLFHHSVPFRSGYSLRSLGILCAQRARGWETFQLTGPNHGRLTEAGYELGPAQRGGGEPGGTVHAARERVDGLTFFRTRPARARWPWLPFAAQRAVLDATAARLAEVVAETRPDLVHAHSPSVNGLAALRVGRRLGIPVAYEVRTPWEDMGVSHGILAENGLRYRLSRRLETWVLRRVDTVIAICEGLRDDLTARGIPGDKLSVVPNAVDPAALGAARGDGPARHRDRIVLGFIGTFFRYEGLQRLIQALPELARAAPPVELLLVGSGPMRPELERLAQQLGVAERVTFAGSVPHDRVASYYAVMDLCVYPRLRMRLTETITPLKPLEAMALSKVVLASDVGGHRELVRDGDTGYLFDAGDPGALARRLGELLAARDRWAGVAERARRYVETERTWRVSAAHYEEAYRRASAMAS